MESFVFLVIKLPSAQAMVQELSTQSGGSSTDLRSIFDRIKQVIIQIRMQFDSERFTYSIMEILRGLIVTKTTWK